MSQQQQQIYYDEQTGEYYTYAEPGQAGASSANHQGRTAIYLVVYFALLAILMYPAQRAQMGIPGVFFSMIGAGLVLALCILVFKWARHRIQAMQLSKRGLLQMAVGYTPSDPAPEPEEATVTSKAPARPASSMALVPATPRALAPYPPEEEIDELPEAIIEDNPAYLSDAYQPNINGLLGATVLLCGIRRSGKSNGLAVLAEELARYYTPLVIGDTEDEYGPLAHPDYMPRGIMAGSADYSNEARAAGIRYVAVDREGAYEFGQSIPRDVLQVVLNLQSFADEDEAALIMAEIIDGMNDWESAQPNARRVPCMFLLDEANKWLPQAIAESCIQERDILHMLQRAVFGQLVRRGGKRGLGVVLTTQRIAELDKRALQSVWKLLFRQTEEVDIARYKAQGLDGDDILGLRQGECFIFSPGVIGFKTVLRERHSPHLAHTPGLSQLASHLRRITSLDLIAGRSYTSVEAEPAAQQPGKQQERITGPLECQPAQPDKQERARPQTLEERAIEAWNAGHQSGRKLAAALDVTEGAGNQLMNKLMAKGLIKPRKQNGNNE